jgi:aldose 1-epimerase
MSKKHISQREVANFKKTFGLLPNGNEVFCYCLQNANGMQLDVINYGATITSLNIPIDNGKVDVVLGFENVEAYAKSFNLPSAPYPGSIVGRFAGRIDNAEFVLNNQKIELTQNHSNHQLHGGHRGFSQASWEVIAFNPDENPSITLAYTSAANEENFPGEVKTEVTYTLTESNELHVSFTAATSEDTIVNLTQHSYFNLDGHDSDVQNQQLYINANQILETTNENIPTGNFVALDDHRFDFRTPKACPTQIDNTFVLEESNLKATLLSPKNKLKMSVFTNQPAIHIYVGGNCFKTIKGKHNTDYHATSGICFEAQNFPDAPNHAHFPSAILKKDETYQHNTIFKFDKL